MIQTAQTASGEHALDITDDQPRLTINKSSHERPNRWFKAFHTKSGFYKLSAFFYYGDRVKISFSLKDPYASHYILIKGLLEFHRSAEYKFNYDREQKTFDLSVTASTLDAVHEFLENITVWVDQELQFKSALKKIIEFESVYKQKAVEVYQWQSGLALARIKTGLD